MLALPPRKSKAASTNGNALSTVLQVVGAAAGIALVLYVVGGLLIAARLHALMLPAETVLGTYPKGELVIAALHALAIGLGLGAAAGLFFWRFPQLFEHWYVRVPIAVLLLTIPMAANELLQPLKTVPRILTAVAWIVALVLATRVLTRTPGRTLSTFVLELFALIVVFGTTVGLIRAAQPPAKLNVVTVYLKDGDRTDGYLVVATGDAVYFAPSVEEDTVGEVVSIPRDEIAHLSIDIRGQNVRPLGVTIGTPFIGRQPSLSPDVTKRRDDVMRLAAEIRTDHRWRVPPVVPADSVDYLSAKNHYEQYLPTKIHPWVSGVACSRCEWPHREVDHRRIVPLRRFWGRSSSLGQSEQQVPPAPSRTREHEWQRPAFLRLCEQSKIASTRDGPFGGGSAATRGGNDALLWRSSDANSVGGMFCCTPTASDYEDEAQALHAVSRLVDSVGTDGAVRAEASSERGVGGPVAN